MKYRNMGNLNSFHYQMQKNKHGLSSPNINIKNNEYDGLMNTANVRKTNNSNVNSSAISSIKIVPNTSIQRIDYNQRVRTELKQLG